MCRTRCRTVFPGLRHRGPAGSCPRPYLEDVDHVVVTEHGNTDRNRTLGFGVAVIALLEEQFDVVDEAQTRRIIWRRDLVTAAAGDGVNGEVRIQG